LNGESATARRIGAVKLKFAKMQGLGNDFVVIDGVRQGVTMTAALAQRLADRHFGIGCDQVLLVEKPRSPQADFRYRIWNADGGEVGQCGNGARCFVRFVRDHGLTDKRELNVETSSGMIVPRLEADGEVTVDMGPPRFAPAAIPFVSESDAPLQPLELRPGRIVQITALSMGNPHAVQVVEDVESAPVVGEGPLIEHHPRFPERVNAGYMQIEDRGRIRLRVWERGAGETLACGTGACAAVAAGIRRGLLDGKVRVATRGGELTIQWRGGDNPVWMTGPAVTVFEGEINVES
jgi:diaminopimelate epimerase